ncbi:VWA domain-containing protein [Herbaspirillum sp. HC18]|nr:VWA domain-containing protein [Herbaspirillum sp. HC18]
MTFAWPWLFLALPLPWLLRLALAPIDTGAALRVPCVHDDAVTRTPRAGLALWIAAFAWLLLMAAAARPQMPAQLRGMPSAPVNARGMMLAFDVSMSMATPDLRHEDRTMERLQAARMLADAFLARRDGDRAGLVVFGSKAYLHTPMTFDLQAVRTALGSVQTGLAGRETALGDAIALGVKYLKTQPAQARVLLLFTDGANSTGTLAPERAAWLAQREGVRIHALGVGASAELDEALLKNIAGQTGGSYLRATDSAAITAFFNRLDSLEPSFAAQQKQPMRELYAWPLALACLLAAGLALHQRRVAVA